MTARSAVIQQPFQVNVVFNGKTRMLHYDAKDLSGAIRKAQLSGHRVLSARKLDDEAIDRTFMGVKLSSVTELKLDNTHKALAIEDTVFRRRKRLEYNKKDKKDLDNE